jgi:hypothetical protein
MIKSKWQVRKWKNNFNGANKHYILEATPSLKKVGEAWQIVYESHQSHDQVSTVCGIFDTKEEAQAHFDSVNCK